MLAQKTDPPDSPEWLACPRSWWSSLLIEHRPVLDHVQAAQPGYQVPGRGGPESGMLFGLMDGVY